MAKVLDTIRNELRIDLPGAIDAAIDLAIGETLFTFCEQSNVWTSTDLVWVTPDVTSYSATPEDGYPLRLIAVEDVAGGRRFDAEFVAPDGVVFPAPLSGVEQVRVTFAVAPDPTTPLSVPEDLLILWREAIKAGARARMMAQPAKPYTAPQLASSNAKKFRSETTRARVAAARKFSIAGQRWCFPGSFAVRRKK